MFFVYVLKFYLLSIKQNYITIYYLKDFAESSSFSNSKSVNTKKLTNVLELPFDVEENSTNINSLHINLTNGLVPEEDSDDDIVGPTMPPTNQTDEEAKEEFCNRLLLLEAKKAEVCFIIKDIK